MKNIEIQFLYQSEGRNYYRSIHDDTEIIWSQDVHNPHDLLISAESFAHIQGYNSYAEMMADDNMLDKINEFMKETRSPFPFINKNDT